MHISLMCVGSPADAHGTYHWEPAVEEHTLGGTVLVGQEQPHWDQQHQYKHYGAGHSHGRIWNTRDKVDRLSRTTQLD